MNTVYIRELAIGEGRPKICVPICGKTGQDILDQAERIHSLPAEIVEWRGDWYDEIFDMSAIFFSFAGNVVLIIEVVLCKSFTFVYILFQLFIEISFLPINTLKSFVKFNTPLSVV